MQHALVWKYSPMGVGIRCPIDDHSFLKTIVQTTLTSVSWNRHCSSIRRTRAAQSHHLLISAVAKRGSLRRQSGRSSRGMTRVGQKHRCRCGGHKAGNQKSTERTHFWIFSSLQDMVAGGIRVPMNGCNLWCYLPMYIPNMVMILLADMIASLTRETSAREISRTRHHRSKKKTRILRRSREREWKKRSRTAIFSKIKNPDHLLKDT